METVNPFQRYSGEAESEPETTSSKKEKRYYWLKLMDGFFDDKHIKLLRSQENGDKMVIIYLMLQLKALKSEGVIDYMRIMPSIEEEIAVDIGESVESVKSTVDMLVKMRLVEALDDSTLFMITKRELFDYGGETAAAERQRKSRENRKNSSL